MINYITSETIVSSILLHKDIHKGSILILEGSTDMRLYGKFIDRDECLLINAHCKQNVINVIELLNEKSELGVLGIIDSDFMRLFDRKLNTPNLFMTDSHDIEIMIIKSDAFDHLLAEFGSAEKIKSLEERKELCIRTLIQITILPLSYLRFISERDHLNLNFQDLKFKKFIKGRTSIILNPEKMIEAVLNNSQIYDINKKELANKIKQLFELKMDPWQLVCGHDYVGMLSISLRKSIGTNNSSEIKPKLLEKSLRLAYQFQYFIMTSLFSSICEWEGENGLQVFKQQELLH